VVQFPVPFNPAACGEPTALSIAERLAVSVPVAAGLKATDKVQLAPAASDVPQVLNESTKLVAFGPVKLKDFADIATEPVLVSVRVCAAEVVPTLVVANVKLTGDSDTVGCLAPVPFRAMVCGESEELSVAMRLAVCVPVVAGLNATESVQLAPAASVVTHVFAVSSKSFAPLPENRYDFTVTVLVPMFFTVSTCAGETEPTGVGGKVSELAEKASVGGETPVPFSAIVCGEPGPLSVATRLVLRVPMIAGLNAIERLQLAPAARDVEHVFVVIAKSPALGPEKRYDFTVSAVDPVLVTTIV